MKVSASIPSVNTPRITSSRTAAAVAIAWFAAHLPSLSPSLEDIDSINFALGLREFNPALHQPHPPGYPVYIALGRVSLAGISSVAALPRPQAEALALASWSAIAGVVAIVAAAVFVERVLGRRSAVAAAALMAASPLFWLSGLRPMTDVPGLAAALVALALIARGQDERRWLMWGALAAGLALGIRSQTMWLTMPLLALGQFWHRRAGAWWLITRPVAALAAGVLAWAVPLVAASGGVAAYLRALGTQAELDFAGVDMLWLNPTPRRLGMSLYETFVLPWVWLPLVVAIACAACAGLVVLAARDRRALLVLAVAFAPYLGFHLLFQETFTVRYALPSVPLVAALAARGVAAAGRASGVLAAAVVAGALYAAVPGGIAFGREAHPAFRAIAEAVARARSEAPAALYAHFSLWRPLQAVDLERLRVVPPRHHFEWLDLVGYWIAGGRQPVWFLADPRRTDLALIDPASRTDVTRYHWAAGDRPELSGTRPIGVDWYRLAPPGWFAGEGWSLTPETGGEARANGKGPDQEPIQAWVRRRAEPMHLMIGTRHLGDPGDPPVDFVLAVDGVERDRWTMRVPQANALRFLDLPDGLAGAGDYAVVTVSARAAGDSARRIPAAVRQFDAQPIARVIYGFGEGWHELEYDSTTGRLWRWSSDRATLRVHGAPRAVRLTLAGESPLRYFDAAPAIGVVAGSETVETFSPNADFEWTVVIPAEVMARAGGVITLVQDRAYLPGAAEGTNDARRLGLRLFDVRVDTVLP